MELIFGQYDRLYLNDQNHKQQYAMFFAAIRQMESLKKNLYFITFVDVRLKIKIKSKISNY